LDWYAILIGTVHNLHMLCYWTNRNIQNATICTKLTVCPLGDGIFFFVSYSWTNSWLCKMWI
jgi:hypothetical protein